MSRARKAVDVAVKLTEEKDGSQTVTTSYHHGPGGIRMEISADKDWLHLVTDEYEGAAMINVEALPAVRRALARLAKQRKAAES